MDRVQDFPKREVLTHVTPTTERPEILQSNP